MVEIWLAGGPKAVMEAVPDWNGKARGNWKTSKARGHLEHGNLNEKIASSLHTFVPPPRDSYHDRIYIINMQGQTDLLSAQLQMLILGSKRF